MKLILNDERKEKLTKILKKYFKDEFEVELSDFQTSQFITFLLEKLGSTIYNQAINDTEKFIKDKLLDLEGDLIEE